MFYNLILLGSTYVDPDKLEKGVEMAKEGFSFIRTFNYIAIYNYIKENFWLEFLGFQIPIIVPIIIGIAILGKIIKMVRTVGVIALLIALVMLFNTVVVDL